MTLVGPFVKSCFCDIRNTSNVGWEGATQCAARTDRIVLQYVDRPVTAGDVPLPQRNALVSAITGVGPVLLHNITFFKCSCALSW